MAVYYFYDGYDKPYIIDLYKDDFQVFHEYLGDVTSDFWNNHYEYKGDDDLRYNTAMYHDYKILRNPTLEELQNINYYYGIGKNDFLEDFLVMEGVVMYG